MDQTSFEDDRLQLRSFVGLIYDFLEELVKTSEFINLFPAEDDTLVLDAWDEVADSRVDVIDGVRSIGSPPLRRVGLIGAQFRLKIALFNRYYGQYVARKRPGAFQDAEFVETLKKLFKHIDILLGAIAVLIRDARPLKQFQEICEARLYDDDCVRPS